MMEPKITPWEGDAPPDEERVRQRLAAEGLRAYPWSNGPGDTYTPHTHAYHKVIYVARGSITFGLPELGRTLTLQAGDRLDLPAGTLHNAVVGPTGVLCYEAHIEASAA
jgi:quercetin dioxygenase-like cupin family protein